MHFHRSDSGRSGRHVSGWGARFGCTQALSTPKSHRLQGGAVVMNPVVSREEWLVARKKLLAREKELTRQRDVLSAERRRLPWVRVEKRYTFDTTDGKCSL